MKFKGLLKIKLLICFMYLFINLTSCSTFNASLDSLLVSPKVDSILIEGTWKLEDFYYMYNKNVGVNPSIPKDSYLFLSNNYFRINDLLFYYDKIKLKNVMLSDYMRVRFKIGDFSFLSLEDKLINIFTMQGKNKEIYEFINYDDDTLLFYYDDDIMYRFKKVSSKIDKNLEDFVSNNYKNNIYEDDSIDILDTGFLISFRSDRKVVDSSIPKSFYKTIWVYQSSDGTYSHEIFDNIVIPKDDDILEIKVSTSDKNNLYEKIDVSKKSNSGNIESKININEELINQFIDITYINDNYIGIRYNQDTDYLGRVTTNKWAVLSIDKPIIENRLNFSDIFDENSNGFYESHRKFIRLLKNKDLDIYDLEPREDSFNLERYGGNWFLRGRINPNVDGDMFTPLDFDIEVLPNEKLVRYNNYYFNLNQIKLKNPEAIDGFISPNRDILIIITKNAIQVYKIIGDKISSNNIMELSIDPGDSIISGNWYVGDEAVNINNLLDEFK